MKICLFFVCFFVFFLGGGILTAGGCFCACVPEREPDEAERLLAVVRRRVRRKLTREGRIEVLLAIQKRKPRTVVGRGGEEPVRLYPGSEPRLGGREKRRAKATNGMQKK